MTAGTKGTVRQPVVAGMFYPGAPTALDADVRAYLDAAGRSAGDAAPPKAVIVPHAGYVYSGAIAGAVFARAAVPARVIVLGPNHTGLGRPAGVRTNPGPAACTRGDLRYLM